MPKNSLEPTQQNNTIHSLHSFPFLDGFTEKQIAALAEYLAPVHFPKGRVVFEQGTRRDSLFLITEGRLSVYKEFGDEPEVFAMLHEGEFCCEEALADPASVHSKNGQAIDNLSLLALSHTAFHGLAAENPEFALLLLERILKTIAERLHHADNKLVTLYHTGRIISITLPLEETGSQILAALHEVIRARRSLFVTFHPEHDRIQLIAQFGFAVPPFRGGNTLKLFADPILGVMAKNKSTILAAPTTWQDKTNDAPYATPSMVGVPIVYDGHAIGAILMIDKENEDFNINNVILLEIVARQIAGAIAEAKDRSRHQAEEELKQVYIRPI